MAIGTALLEAKAHYSVAVALHRMIRQRAVPRRGSLRQIAVHLFNSRAELQRSQFFLRLFKPRRQPVNADSVALRARNLQRFDKLRHRRSPVLPVPPVHRTDQAEASGDSAHGSVAAVRST
jgi:hypothetical protein